jgi:tetratricopeptide (TPR) repeat protein
LHGFEVSMKGQGVVLPGTGVSEPRFCGSNSLVDYRRISDMDLTSPIPLLLFVFVPGRTRRYVALLLVGFGIAAAFNLPWLAKYLPLIGAPEGGLARLASNPSMLIAANSVAGILIVWCLIQLFFATSPQQRLVRTLISRGDLMGAAQLQAREGNLEGALSLFRKQKAWKEAAKIAMDLGRELEAADLLRRAGGQSLGEAVRLYRRNGSIDKAQQCERDHAEWLTSRGRFEEAVEAWMRAGEPRRAAGAAKIALDEGRFSSSHPALAVARRAVEQMGDHAAVARLHELEGNWRAAAHAWRTAGDETRAAENFRKVGMMHDAVVSESAAGHHREAAQLRLQQLKKLHEQMALYDARGVAGDRDAEKLRLQIEREVESLIPVLSELGMQQEMIDMIVASGQAEEAVKRLLQQDEESEAADLAINAQLWHLAVPILERLNRWGEASDIHELMGNIEAAARCAEQGGEYERALELHRSLGSTTGAANCMARLGYLEDALVELHGAGMLEEACETLQNHPGPIPDIPQVVLDMAKWARENDTQEKAIACLQRAVIGVALQPQRLDPAVALAYALYNAGERKAALVQVERILAFDYSCEPAQKLRARIGPDLDGDGTETQPVVARHGEVSPPDQTTQERYEILTELGRGGMGVVYRARDNRLERDVAIKVLRTTSAAEAARLGQEARAAATLNHSGIVTVHDFEAGFDGYFIAMEFVPGEPLDALLKTDPARIRQNLVRLLLRLADAIAYAHSRHVIHRDLKPGNILFTPMNEVKILDFGIAARLDQGEGESASICGTPFYMAPEQIRGLPPTPATDIYAFGATSFHLATGQPPFPSGNVIDAHLTKRPPNPLDLAPDLNPELARIILRCLEKNPENRYSDTGELRNELELLCG